MGSGALLFIEWHVLEIHFLTCESRLHETRFFATHSTAGSRAGVVEHCASFFHWVKRHVIRNHFETSHNCRFLDHASNPQICNSDLLTFCSWYFLSPLVLFFYPITFFFSKVRIVSFISTIRATHFHQCTRLLEHKINPLFYDPCQRCWDSDSGAILLGFDPPKSLSCLRTPPPKLVVE